MLYCFRNYHFLKIYLFLLSYLKLRNKTLNVEWPKIKFMLSISVLMQAVTLIWQRTCLWNNKFTVFYCNFWASLDSGGPQHKTLFAVQWQTHWHSVHDFLITGTILGCPFFNSSLSSDLFYIICNETASFWGQPSERWSPMLGLFGQGCRTPREVLTAEYGEMMKLWLARETEDLWGRPAPVSFCPPKSHLELESLLILNVGLQVRSLLVTALWFLSCVVRTMCLLSVLGLKSKKVHFSKMLLAFYASVYLCVP
jgi:hypothetical protein